MNVRSLAGCRRAFSRAHLAPKAAAARVELELLEKPAIDRQQIPQQCDDDQCRRRAEQYSCQYQTLHVTGCRTI